MVYYVKSNAQLVARRDLFADNRANLSGSQGIPFWEVCERLPDAAQPYDALFFPEGRLRPDRLTAGDLKKYPRLFLPDVRFLTLVQAQALWGYLQRGGQMVVIGDLGANLEPGIGRRLLEKPGVSRLESLEAFAPGSAPQATLKREGDRYRVTLKEGALVLRAEIEQKCINFLFLFPVSGGKGIRSC